MLHQPSLLEPDESRFDDFGKPLTLLNHAGAFEFVERGQHGSAGQGVGTPGVGRMSVRKRGEGIGAAHGGADGHAVAHPLAEADDIRLNTVRRVGIHRSRAAEIGLDLVQDEQRFVLAAEGLQQLQVFRLRVERSAAPQIRLGDQTANAVPDASD